MAFMRRSLLFLALVAPSAALVDGLGQGVTPVEKVVSLLDGLVSEVEAEGRAEATVYSKFSCFCKDTTTAKSTSIISKKDTINQLSADIESNTAEKNEKTSELQTRKENGETMAKQLSDSRSQEAKEQSAFEAEQADLSKALGGLIGAITSMSDSRPTAAPASRSWPPSFLQVSPTIQKQVEDGLALAEAMNLIEAPKREAVVAFLQQGSGARVDPSDPAYDYHSQGIIDLLSKLKGEFEAEKSTLELEWSKAKSSFDAIQLDLSNKIANNAAAMDALKININTLKLTIATDRGFLVENESGLKDDQIYMKDLTQRCEDRANDWDQRAAQRADELTALKGALTILKGDDVTTANTNSSRALLQQSARASKPALLLINKNAAPAATAARVLSFLQVKDEARKGALSTATQAKQDEVAALLADEGHRIGSTVLASLAMHVSANPFFKVKELIQKLIERLVNEATAEATKKGFCDTQLAKANKDRDFRIEETEKLNAEIAQLEAKQDALEAEIASLTTDIAQLDADLTSATAIRGTEKATNIQVITEAKAGLSAVSQAIIILKVFYKNAAKASFVQTKWSPIDEAANSNAAEGSYNGKQAAATGILGLLEVIKTDFARTAQTTEAAEKKAQAEFVEFDRASRADMAGKNMKKELDQSDLKTTKDNIAQKMRDMQDNMDLVDDALRALEELKPTCIDTGMSYADRVAKRNEEIKALNKAHCLLLPDNEAADCA